MKERTDIQTHIKNSWDWVVCAQSGVKALTMREIWTLPVLLCLAQEEELASFSLFREAVSDCSHLGGGSYSC